MSLPQFSVIIIFAMICLDAAAIERRYLANFEDSQWRLKANSALVCELEHQIPLFGAAIFSREAGRPLKLELHSKLHFESGIKVVLRSESSPWAEAQEYLLLAQMETSGNRHFFDIPSVVAEQVYRELMKGRQPSFLIDGAHPVMVSLSAIRFTQALGRFKQCVARLYHDNFYDVRKDLIHFERDSEFPLLGEEERAFSRMLDYFRIDDSIREVVVTGHADKTGVACYNDGLSERRAWYVYEMLLAEGMEPSQLRVEFVGELDPKIKGGSPSALAANRRVAVELRR